MVQNLLERLAIALDQGQIPYLIIGGQAVLLYGEPRLTEDVDITLGVGPENLNLLLELAQKNSWDVLIHDPKTFVQKTLVLPCQDRLSGSRLDFIFSLSEYERQAMKRAHVVAIGAAQVRFASLEDLIIHKLMAGRSRDEEDIRGMLNRQPRLDREYLRFWLQQMDQDPTINMANRLLAIEASLNRTAAD